VNLRPHRPEPPEINLTPLIDVVFLLLIFFMVSTTFRDDGRLRLQLPEAEAEPVPADELELIEVMVDRSGRFYVDAQPVRDSRVETLKQALAGAAGAARDRPVLVKADAQAQHQAVMRVLDAAGQLGMTQIAFAATQIGRSGTETMPHTPSGSAGEGDRGAERAATDARRSGAASEEATR
jgi:biopolymer transport protein ExbD